MTGYDQPGSAFPSSHRKGARIQLWVAQGPGLSAEDRATVSTEALIPMTRDSTPRTPWERSCGASEGQ